MSAIDHKKFNQHQAYHLLKEQPRHKYNHVVQLITEGPEITAEQIAQHARVRVDFVYAVMSDLIHYSW
jgi:hypothetical protein